MFFLQKTNIKRNTIKRHWAGANEHSCWLSRGGIGVETQYSRGSSWIPCCLLVTCYFFIVMLLDNGLSVPGFSILFTGCTLNALDLNIKYTANGLSSYVYCVVYFYIHVTTCSRNVNILLTLLHVWWWTGMFLDNEHLYTQNVFYVKDQSTQLGKGCKLDRNISFWHIWLLPTIIKSSIIETNEHSKIVSFTVSSTSVFRTTSWEGHSHVKYLLSGLQSNDLYLREGKWWIQLSIHLSYSSN